jgi:hypothetical protein
MALPPTMADSKIMLTAQKTGDPTVQPDPFAPVYVLRLEPDGITVFFTPSSAFNIAVNVIVGNPTYEDPECTPSCLQVIIYA